MCLWLKVKKRSRRGAASRNSWIGQRERALVMYWRRRKLCKQTNPHGKSDSCWLKPIPPLPPTPSTASLEQVLRKCAWPPTPLILLLFGLHIWLPHARVFAQLTAKKYIIVNCEETFILIINNIFVHWIFARGYERERESPRETDTYFNSRRAAGTILKV